MKMKLPIFNVILKKNKNMHLHLDNLFDGMMV